MYTRGNRRPSGSPLPRISWCASAPAPPPRSHPTRAGRLRAEEHELVVDVHECPGTSVTSARTRPSRQTRRAGPAAPGRGRQRRPTSNGPAARIATCPLGYGDGWPRTRSNPRDALVRGRRVPLVGLSRWTRPGRRHRRPRPLVNVDDEFVLLGRRPPARVGMRSRRGSWRGAHHDILEVVTQMARRLPRVYHASAVVVVGVRTLTEEIHRWPPESSSGTGYCDLEVDAIVNQPAPRSGCRPGSAAAKRRAATRSSMPRPSGARPTRGAVATPLAHWRPGWSSMPSRST